MWSQANGQDAYALGSNAHALADNSLAIGYVARATAENSVAIGYGAGSLYDYIGSLTRSVGENSTSVGHSAHALGQASTALGYYTYVYGDNSVAVGDNATVGTANTDVDDAVALGSNSKATESNTVSIGNNTTKRRLVNRAAGKADTDGVNVSQLKKLGTATANALGGDSEFSFSTSGNGTLKTSLKVGDDTYSSVQRALDALAGSTVAYDADDKSTITLGGTNGTTITNLAAGVNASDAVNFGQLSSLGDKIASTFGGDFKFENGTLTGGFTYGNETTIQGAFNSIRDELDKLSDGWTFNPVDDAQQSGGDGGAGTGEGATPPASSTIKPGDSLTVNAGSNIEITGSDKDYTVSVSDNPKFDSVSAADGKVTADEDGLTVAGTDGNSVKIDGDSVTVADKVTIDKNGIDMDGTKLTGLGAGSISEGSTDAVSGGQLWETNQTVDEIGSVLGGAENGYKKPTFDTVTANDINVGKINISGSGINMGGANINTGGGNIDMGGGRITNVAGGAIAQNSTDAVNGGQLWDAYQRMDAMGGDIYRRMDDLREDVNIVGAHAAALSGLHPIQYNPYEPTTLSAAIGTYRDEYAVAVGVFHYVRENLMFNVGASLCSDGDLMGRAGVSLAVGRSTKRKPELARDMAGMQRQMYVMQAKLERLEAENKQSETAEAKLRTENEQNRRIIEQNAATLRKNEEIMKKNAELIRELTKKLEAQK
ncbi:YadA-like family protein [uncultured Cloacibacillus sp.]|uniref:YadA-like family protein n=1 Tax=uncultured Cloacibacillus sp. TaxID=889794 RepID=UPI0032099E5C